MRQHGKMLARPYAASYVKAAQSGSYGLELITAACDEPRALERVLKSLGKAFSDEINESNVAALCERASAPLLARSLAKLLRRCEEAYVVKATLVVLEHCLSKNCDRHGICDAVRKLARRRIGRDKLRKIVCGAGGDILGAYIDEGVDGFDLIAAAKSGDVELLKQAIRGEEAKAKKQARRRKEGTPTKGARASVSFSLERRADSVEEAGAPIVITWVSTREDKKEGQVALLNEEAPAVQFKALVGSRFRARKVSGEPIVDFVVEFKDENFTVPAPPGTKLYKDTPPLPPNVEKSQASIKAGKALAAFEKKSRVSPPPMVNLTNTPR
mgnify:CR=1 FL=1